MNHHTTTDFWDCYNKLPEAVGEVQKAQGLVASGDGDEELKQQVRQWRADLDTATVGPKGDPWKVAGVRLKKDTDTGATKTALIALTSERSDSEGSPWWLMWGSAFVSMAIVLAVRLFGPQPAFTPADAVASNLDFERIVVRLRI